MAINPFGIVQQVEQQVEAEAQQPAFQPTLDKETTRRLAEQYKANPKAFNPQTLAQLENHAAYHQVPFYPGEFNLGEAVMQLGKGFASGFTTLEVGEHPDNEYENIARSLGHLIGFAPGILAHPLKALGAVSLARKVGKVKSVPLFLSGKATEKLGKVLGPAVKAAAQGRSGATATAANWLLKNQVGRATTHVAEGAFNLGLASGISAWQGGVDAIMHSAGHGALFGGVFRTLGNVVNTGDKTADTAIRAIAGSVFQGLPATMRGATSAEQVYEYLLGAYFGAGETSWYKHGANRFMRDMQKEMPKNAEMEYTSDPRLMGERWRNLHEREQKQVEKQIEEVISPEFQRVRGWTLLKYLGDRGVKVEGKITPEGDITKEGYEFLVKEKKAGLDKAFKESDMEVPEPELTPEGVKVAPAAQRFTEKIKQIDVDVAASQKEMRVLQDSLDAELAKKKEGEQDDIKISYARDKIKELKDNVETKLLERVKIQDSIKGIGTQLELFVENGNDNDVGLVTTNSNESVVGHRALQFVEHNLKNVWDVKDFSAEMKADLKTLAANELNGILLKNLKRGKNPDTKVIMKEIKSQFKTAIEPELEGSLRQWMNQLNKGHKQKFLRVKLIPTVYDDTGEIVRPAEVKVEEFNTKQPYTAGGARKMVVEPIKLIEEVYIENGGKVGKRDIGSLITIDHLTVQKKDGSLKDKKLSDIRKEDDFDMTNRYEDTISNIQNKMHKKGFYMFGGRGDADKLFFVKFHPLTSPKEMVITKSSAEIRNEFEDWVSNPNYSPRAKKDIIRKDIKDYDESKAMIEFVAWQNKDNPEYKGKPLRIKDGEFVDRKELQKSKPIRGIDSYLDKNVFKTNDYKLAEKDFLDRMFHMKDSEAKKLHKKIVKSNILYDLGMNGLSVNKKNLKEIWENKDGFLNNALAYNKRLQILFTPSWAGSREYAEQTFGKKGETPDKDFIKAGNRFRYIVIPDLKDLPKGLHSEKLLDFDAQLYKEHVDGAIIGRDDVVNYNNKDAGTPESGQNKAFIVSPESVTKNKKTTELGSLYGKFMFHKAGDKLTEAMKKKGIHYIIHESAAKQMGLRKYNNYSLKSKNIGLENDSIYHLDPRHIKYNYSVKQGKNMYLHNARIPKQWFGALNSKILVKPIPTDVINDIFNETIYKTYTGEKEWNTKLSEYLEKPTPQKEAELLNNIDKIGVNDLLRVINSSEGTSFADGAYQKLLRINKEIALSNAKEEGTRAEDLNEYLHELDDFNTVTDRLIREGMNIARGKDAMSSAIFAHKWIRPYRIQVMKNYIMSQVTKPKIKNSLASRMRPYDLGLQNDWDGYNSKLKLLKKRDDIFFLDNDYRNMPLNTYLKESRGVQARTLGEFWDALQKGTYDGFKKEAEEVLRAMVVRVPMDSVSGAHALKFMGFTGRNGHGVLMHPRSMRALGGADLDGDEAFVFFGGKNSTGEGEGMKKSWKDAFAANKDEYVEYVSKNKINGEYKYLTKDEYDNLEKPVKVVKTVAKPKPAPEVKVLTPDTPIPAPLAGNSGVYYSPGAYKSIQTQFPMFKQLIKDSGIRKWGKGVAWYGDVPYEYSGVRHEAQGMPGEFKQLARHIEKELGVKEGYFNSALVNFFPKGQKLGEHRDNEPIFVRDDAKKTMGKVATISLGADSDVIIRDGKGGPIKDRVSLKDGDLYVMPGQGWQNRYTHEVSQVPGERLSFTFRHIPKSVLKKFNAKPLTYKRKTPIKNLTSVKPPRNVKGKQDDYAPFIPDNKRGKVNRPDGEYGGQSFEDLLTIGATAYSKKLAKSKVWMYSPDPRRQISENVVSGRNLLGGVSTMTQTMKAAHDVMSNLKVKEDKFRFEVPNEKNANHGTWEVVIEPRQEKEWLNYARRLSSSMVAFTSDPMDVGGIKSYDFLWSQLHDAYFRIKEVRKIEQKEQIDKDTGEVKEYETITEVVDFRKNKEFYEQFDPSNDYFWLPLEAQAGKLRKGLVKQFADLNSGLFGRDYTSGRNWSETEVRDKVEFLKGINENHLTNMLGKQGKVISETESWSDNILNKIDINNLKDLYKEMNTLAKRFKMEMKDEKADWIEDIMGRSSFTIPEDKFVMKILDDKYKPWQHGARQDKDTQEWTGRDAMATDDFGANPGKLYRFVKDLPFTFSEYENKWRTKSKKQTTSWKKKQQNMARQEFRQDLKADKLTNQQRRDVVEEVIKQAEDYILTNDIHDMVSLKLMTDLVKSNRAVLTDDVIKEIHTKVEEIKNNSYLANREKMDVNSFYETNSYASKEVRDSWELVEEAQRLAGVKKTETESSAKMDQMEADKVMRDYKKTLNSAAEKRLFDYFMLGSYNRAKKTIKELLSVKKKDGEALISSIGQIDAATNYWYKFTGARTSMMKLGFSSEAIPPSSIRAFLKQYMKLTGKALKQNQSELKKMQNLAQKLDTKTIKYEQEDVPFIEDRTPKKISDSYVGDMQNYEGLVKGKLPKDQEKIIVELADNLAHLHNTHSMNLNHITQGIIGKPLNEMSKQDYISLNEFFKDIRRGSIWQRLFGEDAPDMKRRYHMLFPKSVNKEMMKYDILWLKKEGWFKMKGKEVFGTISKPSWWLEGIQDWISRMGEKSMDLADALKMEINTNLSFYVENVSNGETLRRFAVRKMERDLQHNIITEKTSLRSRDQKRILAEEYENRYQEMWKDKDVQRALEKEYSITNPKGERERVSGTEIVERISKIYENMNERIFEIISGKPGALIKYQRKDDNGILEFFDEDRVEPKIDWKLFVKDISNAYKKGEDIPLYFGIDGLRQIGRSMKLDFAWNRVKELREQFEVASKKKVKDRTEEEQHLLDTFDYRMKESEKLINKLESSKITKTGQYNFKTYFPHMFHGKEEAKKSLERQLKAIERDTEMPEEVKQEERIKLMHRMNTMTGDWVDSHGEIWENYDKAAEQILGNRVKKGEKIKWTDLDLTSPNMMSRSTHIPGWSIDHTSYEVYAGNIANTYFTQMNQIFTRAMINQFRDRGIKKGWNKIKFGDGSDLTLLQKWENYLKLYAQEAMGGNSVIPDYIYNDPGMKIKGTPYGWWADNRVKKKMQKIKDALISDKTKYPHLNKLMKEIPYQTLRKISNLEAKFELASLLAHPKSAVGNVFGGSIHTIQSAGYQNWKKGRDIKWLQRINPEWKSIDDINRFIVKHGVVPDFMMNEWGLNPEVMRRGKQDFMKDVVKNMQDGKINRKTFNDLMHKHKLSKSMMQLAANFMSKPEMMLRRQAFMAHYVQAWERFDGAIDNIDHPFLIEMAKKGVQATQFLYSAPYRPAFARSALGKIMTRFQLWQWNAVRFRNDIAREARIFGFQEGTPAYEKFVRTLQTDMFVFAMANVFMYSLFETALPAPWNWMQDTADWIFGDEKERERTFMGTWPANVAPLQLVTPPIARLPVAGLDAFIADDWKRFSNYHIYTMFPFGRIIKDFSPWASNNLLENPMMVIDKFTGMPMYGTQRMAKRIKDEGVYKP